MRKRVVDYQKWKSIRPKHCSGFIYFALPKFTNRANSYSGKLNDNNLKECAQIC